MKYEEMINEISNLSQSQLESIKTKIEEDLKQRFAIGERNFREEIVEILRGIERKHRGEHYDKTSIAYTELREKLGNPDEDMFNSLINDILGDGIAYEPIPGKIKII